MDLKSELSENVASCELKLRLKKEGITKETSRLLTVHIINPGVLRLYAPWERAACSNREPGKVGEKRRGTEINPETKRAFTAATSQRVPQTSPAGPRDLFVRSSLVKMGADWVPAPACDLGQELRRGKAAASKR